jgi:phosphoribosylaminoimidazole-succinocarboxamide synthase
MEKRALRYEGKAKKVYETADPNLLVVEYKDDATAFNAQKRGTIAGKGAVNNAVTSRLYPLLAEQGVPNHFVRQLSEREQLVQAVNIVPLEVVVRNVAAGSFAKRLGIEEGQLLSRPITELYYKSDALGDPLVNADTALSLGWASEAEIAEILRLAQRVNQVLQAFFATRRVQLVDFKLEFGVNAREQLLLADEISPDTCRFWDMDSGERLDKDRFRRDLGQVEEAYQEMLQRVLS